MPVRRNGGNYLKLYSFIGLTPFLASTMLGIEHYIEQYVLHVFLGTTPTHFSSQFSLRNHLTMFIRVTVEQQG